MGPLSHGPGWQLHTATTASRQRGARGSGNAWAVLTAMYRTVAKQRLPPCTSRYRKCRDLQLNCLLYFKGVPHPLNPDLVSA
jgi:hypothetical protein